MGDNRLEQQLAGLGERRREVPLGFSLAVDEVLGSIESQSGRQIPPRPKSSARRRIIAYRTIAVCAAGVLLIGSGYVSPAMANVLKQIPLVGSIFEKSTDPVMQKVSSAGMVNEVSRMAADKGITMAIRDAYFDGGKLAIGYSLEFGEGVRLEANASDGELIPISFNVKINGQSLSYIGDFEQQEEVGGLVQGLLKLSVQAEQPISPPYNVEFSVDQIDRTNGQWEFVFSADNAQVESKKSVLTPDAAEAALGDYTINIEEVQFNPTNTLLNIRKTGPKSGINDVAFKVYDGNGIVLENGAIGSRVTELEDGTGTMIETIELPPIEKQNLTVEAFLPNLIQGDAVSPDTIHEIRLTEEELPYVITIGKEKYTLTIDELVRLSDRTELYFKVDGPPILQLHHMMLKDAGGETIPANHYIPTKADDGRFVHMYPSVDSSEELSLVVRANKDWVRNSVMIEVPLR
jgi:hypothetical protein